MVEGYVSTLHRAGKRRGPVGEAPYRARAWRPRPPRQSSRPPARAAWRARATQSRARQRQASATGLSSGSDEERPGVRGCGDDLGVLACVAFQQGACQVHVGPRRQDSAQRLLGLQPDLKLGHGRTAGNTTVSMGSVSGVRVAPRGRTAGSAVRSRAATRRSSWTGSMVAAGPCRRSWCTCTEALLSPRHGSLKGQPSHCLRRLRRVRGATGNPLNSRLHRRTSEGLRRLRGTTGRCRYHSFAVLDKADGADA